MNHQLDANQGCSTQPSTLLFQVSTAMSPLSQGYESTRTVPVFHSASQTIHHSSSHRLLNTHSNPGTPTLFYPSCITQENGPSYLPCIPSGCPPASRALVHMVKNIHVGTLRIHSCEHKLTHANAPHTCKH